MNDEFKTTNEYFHEFIGGKKINEEYFHPLFGKTKDLKYHESWDWLMFLVDRIEKFIKTEREIQITLMRNYANIKFGYNSDGKIQDKAENKLLALYYCCHMFLNKFYKPTQIISTGELFLISDFDEDIKNDEDNFTEEVLFELKKNNAFIEFIENSKTEEIVTLYKMYLYNKIKNGTLVDFEIEVCKKELLLRNTDIQSL